MILCSLQPLHMITKRNGGFGKKKIKLNWLFGVMWTKTSFFWPHLSLFNLWFYSCIHAMKQVFLLVCVLQETIM